MAQNLVKPLSCRSIRDLRADCGIVRAPGIFSPWQARANVFPAVSQFKRLIRRWHFNMCIAKMRRELCH
jgi:hypothetical protein